MATILYPGELACRPTHAWLSCSEIVPETLPARSASKDKSFPCWRCGPASKGFVQKL